MCLKSRSAQSSDSVAFPSITISYCVVLRRCSIFPTLPLLRAKAHRKSPYASKMFAPKLANLTKIISKTLCSVGFRPEYSKPSGRPCLGSPSSSFTKLGWLKCFQFSSWMLSLPCYFWEVVVVHN